MNLIKPKHRNESLKDFYLNEIKLEKSRDWIYMYYELDGVEYMKKTFITDAMEIIEHL